MLNLSEIEKFYSENERAFKKNLLREYLQYKILQIIFDSDYSSKLAFMGGTSLRIVFGTKRFSEDLDFDNFGLNEKEFNSLSSIVAKSLEKEGYKVEIKTVHRGAFRCYVRLPGLLHENKLSVYEGEKILIQLDTEAQQFEYKPEPFLLNKFDIFTRIYISPKDVLLSQKIWAILNRKVPKGRDFYDAMFLFSIAKPDYNYLKIKAGIENGQMLKERFLSRIKEIDFNLVAQDVSPFLLNQEDKKRVLLFDEFIKNMNI